MNANFASFPAMKEVERMHYPGGNMLRDSLSIVDPEAYEIIRKVSLLTIFPVVPICLNIFFKLHKILAEFLV